MTRSSGVSVPEPAPGDVDRLIEELEALPFILLEGRAPGSSLGGSETS